MLPMLTMVGHCRQDNIIYKCTKLHNRSSNRKRDILCAAHAIVLDVLWRGASPLNIFQKKIYGHIYIT